MRRGYLVASVAIISLACGYIVGKGGTSKADATQSNPEASARPERPSPKKASPRTTDDSDLLDSILAGRAIGEIPPADLATLIAKLSKFNSSNDPLSVAKQRYQLQLLLAKLSPADLSRIADTIFSDPEAKKGSALSFVLSTLAGKDSTRALDWLSRQGNPPGLFPAVINAIARNDPNAASDLFHKSLLDGAISKGDLWSASYGIGQELAKLGADPLLAFIDSLPQLQQSNILRNVIKSVPPVECIRLLEKVYGRTGGGKFEDMNFLFTSILGSNEAGAKEWFSKLPEGEEKSALRLDAAYSLFTLGERDASAKWMREAMASAPGKEKEILKKVLKDMPYNDTEGFPFFARLLPEGVEFTAKDLDIEALSLRYNGTASLTAMASAIRNPREQALLISESLKNGYIEIGNAKNFNETDYEILSRQIAAMGFTGENATLVDNALQAARSSANP